MAKTDTAVASTERDLSLREEILEACIRYLKVHGSEKLSITGLAKVAKVSRQTVYNYFKTKAALMEAVEAYLEEQFIERIQVEAGSCKTLVERVSIICITVRRSWLDKSQAPWFGFMSPLEEATLVVSQAPELCQRLMDVVEQYVEQAKSNGEIGPNINVRRASDWIARIIFSFAFDPADERLNEPAEIRKFIRTFLVTGLSGN